MSAVNQLRLFIALTLLSLPVSGMAVGTMAVMALTHRGLCS